MGTFVFFGASGDLFTKKLVPAYERLIKQGDLPADTKLVGISRTQMSVSEFRSVVQKIAPGIAPETISYMTGDVADPALPERFSKALEGDRAVFYLALPPALYTTALRAIAAIPSSFGAVASGRHTLIEKPFGTSLAEAQALDQVIDDTVGEHGIFRVDHYIQKEAVQNILAYRFSNELFGSVWGDQATSHIHAFLYEADTLLGRGAFYDAAGALNDVVQNHLLEMFAAATMNNPGKFSPERTREARTEVLSRLRVAPEGHIRAQYEGYRDTPGVASDSQTETYVRVQAFLDRSDGEHVPIVLEAGKGLSRRHSGVRMYLKQSGTRICFDELCSYENVFEFLLAPEERTTLAVWGKKPGLANRLMPHDLSFSFSEIENAPYIDRAYDRVLYDAWNNDPSRFVAREEARAAWRFIDEARNALHKEPLLIYPQGTMPSPS